MKGHPINIDAMHRSLWRKSDRLGRIRLKQKEYAEQLGIAPETVCRTLSKMTREGRIKKIASERNNVGVYLVKDPDAAQPALLEN